LQRNKIDTFCVLEEYSVGSFADGYIDLKNPPCKILWKLNGKTYFTKKNENFDYNFIEINAEEIWRFYFDNIKTIKSEKVKKYEAVYFSNGKKEILMSSINHSYHQNFKFIINKKIVEKEFDKYVLLEFNNIDKKNRNINYKHNNNLLSKKLIDQLSMLLEKKIKLLKKLA
jgi:hypothetical protein